MRRQDSSYSEDSPDTYTPDEPAYDGSTYARLSPAWGTGTDAGIGQNIDNLDAGNYWMAYKYRVPAYALNGPDCSLTVYINNIVVQGPSTPDMSNPTNEWQAAGGFFTVPPELAGPSYLWIDFYCPEIDDSDDSGFNKRQNPNAAASSGAPAGSSSSGSYPSGPPSAASYADPLPTIPLVDIDYIRMGLDDASWAAYRGPTAAGDAQAASVAADVANAAPVAAQAAAAGAAGGSAPSSGSGQSASSGAPSYAAQGFTDSAPSGQSQK